MRSQPRGAPALSPGVVRGCQTPGKHSALPAAPRAPTLHILGDHSSPSGSPTARVFPTGHPRHLPVRSFTIPTADVLTMHPKQQHPPGIALQTQQRDGTDGGKLLGRCCVSKDTIVGGKCKWTDPAARRPLSSTMLHRCWSSGWHLILAGMRPSSASGEGVQKAMSSGPGGIAIAELIGPKNPPGSCSVVKKR